MERGVFGKKTASSQRPRVDRFVPARASLDGLRRRTVLHDSSADDAQLSQEFWCSKRLQQQLYTSHLEEAFGVEQKNPPLQSCSNKEKWPNYCIQPWPCIPRKKGYLTPADSVLDLPLYSFAAFPEVLDWNLDDVLVAALGNKYYKFSWRHQQLVGRGYTQRYVHCCKFDPRGELLALGMGRSIVEVHHHATSKCISISTCRCQESYFADCIVSAIEWSPTGNSFVSGCTRGVLTVFSRAGKVVNWRHMYLDVIQHVRVSPDARYVAVSAVNAYFVLIVVWPSLSTFLSLDTDKTWVVKTLNWHPWRSALLGVGATRTSKKRNASIALWDVPPSKLRHINITPSYDIIDTMLFSHRTGEMVLSLYNSETGNLKGARLAVLSDPDTVVDQWGGRQHLDRIRTMVLSPDGTKLATATEDEDLIIWHFLPESKEKRKNSAKRRFSALPVCMDLATFGSSLR